MGVLSFLRGLRTSETEIEVESSSDTDDHSEESKPYDHIRDEVYQELLDHGPLTEDEIMSEVDVFDPNTVRAAIVDLNEDGEIRSVDIGGVGGYKARGRSK